MNHDAVFVLSTGRCGTQWLCDALASAYGDDVAVTHEPLLAAYQPRRFLRGSAERLRQLGDIPKVAEHIAHIRHQLRDRPYIETGWPHFAALPWLHEALDGRLRIVHLIRHPVATALSLATHDVYRRNDWIADGALRPGDTGCLQTHLAARWPTMSGYERCLFWWGEIHRYAIDLKRQRPDLPWLSLRFEDLFGADPEPLQDLVRFCGLPSRLELQRLRGCRIDRYRKKSPPQDWRTIERYPLVMALMQQFGYSLSEIDDDALSSRYFDAQEYLHKPRWRRAIEAIFPAQNPY
jgi:hypothetical protein